MSNMPNMRIRENKAIQDAYNWMKRLGVLTETDVHHLLCEMSQINAKDKNGCFPSDQWQIYVMGRDEHMPPHLHIIHLGDNGFVLRFDINTCRTIYETSMSDRASIMKNREKYTDNIENMVGVTSFEEVTEMLKIWYKEPCTRNNANGLSNYEYARREWNDLYGERIGICDYQRDLDTDKPMPQSRDELRTIIIQRIERDGSNCNLNDIDVSKIKNMTTLFHELDFNGDISEWDVSHVLNMQMMFFGSNFNQNISMWVINPKCQTYGMFDNCPIREEYKPKIHNHL